MDKRIVSLIRPKECIYLLLYAILNSILNFSIIFIINNALIGNPGFGENYMIIVFLATVVYACLLNVIFQKWLNKYSFKILYKSEKQLFHKILNAPLTALEKFGNERFYSVMEDIRTFTAIPATVTYTINSLLMLILGLVYMFTLSISAATVVTLLISLIAACYVFITNSMSSQIHTLRKYNELYYAYVKDLFLGFKELKLSWVRRQNLMTKHLSKNLHLSEKLDFKINYIFLSVHMISQYGLYIVIAMILFGLPALGLIKQEDVIIYVVVLLFISGPINTLVSLQQTYSQFLVALRRVSKFGEDFKAHVASDHTVVLDDNRFQSLKLQDVSFRYKGESLDDNFTLGPINFQVESGEVVFVMGGNGSGKSTFIKVLTGLYQPSKGQILLNQHGDISNDELQNSMAVIFADNHIFSQNYENYEVQNNEAYKSLLKTMQLDEVVTDDSEGSARRTFSKGQSKRMSMIFALLENKPVLILDEWAADQDPHFRKFFYEELIPSLKKKGKTIIAVTHDDAYFNHADRIVKIEYGQISKDVTSSEFTNSSDVLAV